MADICVRGFKIRSLVEVVSITGENGTSILFSPAEGNTIRNLIGSGMSMESLPILPKEIHIDHFYLEFKPDDTIELFAADRQDRLTGLTWKTLDDLSVAIDDAIKVIANERANRPSPRRSFANPGGPD